MRRRIRGRRQRHTMGTNRRTTVHFRKTPNPTKRMRRCCCTSWYHNDGTSIFIHHFRQFLIGISDHNLLHSLQLIQLILNRLHFLFSFFLSQSHLFFHLFPPFTFLFLDLFLHFPFLLLHFRLHLLPLFFHLPHRHFLLFLLLLSL